MYAALGDHLGVIEAEYFGQVLTGIGQSTIDRILASAVSGGAINGPQTVARDRNQYVQNLPGSHTSMGHLMGHLEATMITDMNQGLRAVSAKPLVRERRLGDLNPGWARTQTALAVPSPPPKAR